MRALVSAVVLCASITAAHAQWVIQERKDPVTDDAQAIGSLKAADTGAILVIGCGGPKGLGVLFKPTVYVAGIGRKEAQVVYRINDELPFNTTWPTLQGGSALSADSPYSLIGKFRDNDKFFVRAFDFQGLPHDATFMMANISELKRSMTATCRISVP